MWTSEQKACTLYRSSSSSGGANKRKRPAVPDEVSHVLDMTRRELVELCKRHKGHHGQRCNATSHVLRHLARILREVERLKKSLQRDSMHAYEDYVPMEQITDALGADLVTTIQRLFPVSHETALRLLFMDHAMNLDAIRVLAASFSGYEEYEP
jgi:hypothetical protein